MITINGKDYVANFTIGVLEEIEKATEVNLMFGKGAIDNVTKQMVFVSKSTGCEVDALKNLKPKDFLRIFSECMKVYLAEFKDDSKKNEAENL